ncbi:MAG TPA: hypothetical protein DEG55_04990 [Acidaminococcaceae bacterium]|nr:hypothetical protein [Acidaminococcaceae bacterium]
MSKTTFEVKNGVAIILLNDPDHLNPLDQATDIELLNHLTYCEQSPEVKVVVLGGANLALASGFHAYKKTGRFPSLRWNHVLFIL